MLVAGALLPLPFAGAGTATGAEAGALHDATGDIRTTDRQQVSSGGTVRWAVDAAPATFNIFQPDAGEATAKVTGATLPALFTLDEQGAPKANEDYLRSAEVTSTEPRQTVVYKLNRKARWSDGRAVSAADFRAQWKALSGKSDAYWTARNSGYERIRKVTRGDGAGEVKVVFAKPYADWRSLFTPLYPRQAMRGPKSFNDRTRIALPASAGPFRVVGTAKGGSKSKAGKAGKGQAKDVTTVLERNPHWWGERAKLSRIELTAVPRDKRARALARGKLDLADVDEASARKIGAAHQLGGPQRAHHRHGDKPAHKDEQAPRQGDHAAHQDQHADRPAAHPHGHADRKRAALPKGLGKALRKYEVRKALDSAYTQLSLNGSGGPLADERVRRAVVRALDRGELAHKALSGIGLPDKPLGNHLRMANQDGYRDNSDAAGGKDIDSAQSLLADAGWKTGGSILQGKAAGADKPGGKKGHGEHGAHKGHGEHGAHGKKPGGGPGEPPAEASSPDAGASAPYRAEAEASVVRLTRAQMARVTGKPLSLVASATGQRGALLAQAAHIDLAQARLGDSPRKLSRARAALATAENVRATGGELRLLTGGKSMAVRTRNGKPLALRFVLPGGPGSAPLRATGRRVADMLNGVGIRTQIKEVPDESYFKDHIAAGEYDLALFTWPASAYPATETKPIFSKPQPAADGSLLVEQNYARVGTDQIDQLFEQATGELDDSRRRELMGKADARIWAVAGSVPLYQRPQLIAAKRGLANAGAFGFTTPRYQDIGYHKG